ncbi:hypothetical protein SAMN03080594_109190 [Arenibacter palladensis]|uniref:Uncharacterized protein n=1 Tax=Arenibacter palladensis TaxID=237373 RepID=A0A1M5FRK3_9FLAO|nr:DUF6452 family protein [Arenibacter palladensis]SHF94133.1 hypothetical protein SAMN03080594_109190 [Arenibacter palladensis]
MKKSHILILLTIVLIGFGACEKDDICIDGDTPLLIIRFYDVDNPTELKDVTDFRIVGVGQNTTVTTVSDRTDTDSIAIPLKVTENTTGFYFISNSSDVETTDSSGETITVEGGDLDTLYFNYSRIDKFVSRACGYIANYEDLTSDLKTETDNWIKDIEIVTPLVENSTAAHVKIYH